MDKVINGAPFVTALKRIANPKGDLMHAMKASDTGFAGFGEAYFTTVNHGDTKGWKLHQRMTMNLVVPQGRVLFFLYDEQAGVSTTVEVGDANYVRLTVPPGIWVAFQGLGQNLNLVLNLASIEHDPTEAITAPLDQFSLGTST